MKIRFDDFTISQLGPDNLDEILQIQEETLADLPSADILRRNTPEMLAECLTAPHVTMGAYHNGVLAAFSILYYPHDDAENLALYLRSVDITGLKAANNKLCIVRRAFRGNSLQYNLGLILERRAASDGTDLLCATVSPHNPYSINNILRLGFTYDCTLSKYGFERNLYYKLIRNGISTAGE